MSLFFEGKAKSSECIDQLYFLLCLTIYAFVIPVNVHIEMEATKYACFVVMALLVPLVECEYVVEGGVASLTFSYSCNSNKVTLQRTHFAPFFDSESPDLPLPSNMEVRNGNDGEICFLYLTINPVTRDDRGGYILTAYKNDLLFEDDRVFLNVAYPPGKASCSLIEGYIDPDWITLQCTAPVGTVSGYIMCYQDGNVIAPLTSPQENDTTLSQTLLAKVGTLVYCCSSTLGKTKDICECKDSVWDTIQNNKVNNFTSPCPPTEPMPHPAFSHYTTDMPLVSTTHTHTESVCPRKRSIAIIVPIVAICLLILGCIIFVVCHFKQRAKLIKQHPKMIAVYSETANEETLEYCIKDV